uniref:Uncharacterized protein n=1 Tax=Panagrolaimus sp. ES5 TaxID=591445 RepID=A0AC34GA59_9BILA
MNVSNGFGARQDHRGGRGGGSTQPQRNFNQNPRRGGPTSSGCSTFRQPHHSNNGANGDQNAPNKFEHQRKAMPKTEGGKPQTQNIKDANNVGVDKNGPSNRGKNFKVNAMAFFIKYLFFDFLAV